MLSIPPSRRRVRVPVTTRSRFRQTDQLAASTSPFTEPTSPNPTLTHYAEATEKLHSYGSYLIQCLPKYIQQFSVLKDELTLYVPPSGVVPVLTFLRDHSQCQYKACMDITGVDFPERDKRFEVVYNLLSVRYGGRIRVKTYASEVDAVPSATGIFRGADWCVSVQPLLRCAISRPCTGTSARSGTCMECFSKTTPTCASVPNCYYM